MKNITINEANTVMSLSLPEQFLKGVRGLFALCLAPFGTLALLLVMHSLIKSDLPEPEPAKTIEYHAVFDIPGEEPVPEEAPLDPPSEVKLPPEIIPFGSIDPVDKNLFTGIEKVETVDPVFNPWDNNSDSPIRLVAVAPIYPQQQANRGVEGYVDVQFDITKSGTTENIEIVAYHPSTVFNRSVIRAVSRWRYQPRVIEGESVGTKGVLDRVTFELEQ